MKNKVFSLLKFIIGWPLSILALFFIIKVVAPQAPQFLSRLHEVSLPLLSLAVASFLIYFFFRGYIWQRLVKQAGYDISYKDINFIWAASELKRYIPGNIWSFIGRSVQLAEKGMSKKDIATCTLYEMELLVFGATGSSLLALPFVITHFGLQAYWQPLLIVGFFVGILLYAFHRKLQIKLVILPNFNPLELIILAFLSIIPFFFFGLGYYFTFISFIAFDPNLIWQLVGVSVLSFLVGYLSILTPSGIGVREGALAFALAKIIPASTAGFVALFGRFVLTVTEIIYVLLSYLWEHAKIKVFHTMETWIGKNKPLLIVLFLIVTYIGYFATVTVLRYDNIITGKYDLGNMSQTVWNTTQGDIFMLTNPDTAEFSSRLAIHADFILILFAPFYALWPDPRIMLILQTVIIGFGAYFIYALGTRILKNNALAIVFTLLFLLNPGLQWTNLYDFHAVTLATTFLLGAFYFFIQKRYRLFLLFAILAGLCKEEVWVIIAIFGFFSIVLHKRYVFGTLLFLLCSSLFYFLISYAIPQSLGANHFALSYFSAYGDSPSTIIKNIFFEPQQTISTLLMEDRTTYLRQLFEPLGYLSLLSPFVLIFALPSLMINLLSNNANLHQIYYQYSATITPFLFIAAILGVANCKKLLKRFIPQLPETFSISIIIIYLLFMGLYSAYLFGPLPGAKHSNDNMFVKQETNKETITDALSLIPKDARVAASNNIASHLSNRKHIYVLPVGIEKADYIVLYFPKEPTWESTQKDIILIEQLREDNYYQIISENESLVIFKKKN